MILLMLLIVKGHLLEVYHLLDMYEILPSSSTLFTLVLWDYGMDCPLTFRFLILYLTSTEFLKGIHWLHFINPLSNSFVCLCFVVFVCLFVCFFVFCCCCFFGNSFAQLCHFYTKELGFGQKIDLKKPCVGLERY